MKHTDVEKRQMHPQVKICGITSPEEAIRCAEMGADAIGCVFFPASPRNISVERAREICRAVPPGVPCVGVFVNENGQRVKEIVDRCGLSFAQLHGVETPELVRELSVSGIRVLKAVFSGGKPGLSAAASYQDASAILVECSGGPLPGGNAMAWDWGEAAPLAKPHGLVLAGGINPTNVNWALLQAEPDAVDVSSGLEAGPGRKDFEKVKHFIELVQSHRPGRTYRRIFR